MSHLHLIIGNKNYSSWSLRGWLMAKAAGIEFDEIVVPLDLPETQPTIRKHSPSGRVPVLLHRGLRLGQVERHHDLLELDAGGLGHQPAAQRPRGIVLVADHQREVGHTPSLPAPHFGRQC